MKRPLVSLSSILSIVAIFVWQTSAFAALSVKEYSYTDTNTGAESMALGADGNTWFVKGTSPTVVGKVTPSGTVTKYTDPNGNGSGWGIAAGPDGNMWFTQQAGNVIGKITPSGTITDYPITTSSAQPYAITAGPDGNMWFTEQNSDKIGKITMTGVVTEYSVPTVSAQPSGIVAGSDGNLWFTEVNGNNIGKITPSGTITEYSDPTAYPWMMVKGSDGNVWFTTGNGVGKITPSGTITSVATVGTLPWALTEGPDNSVWVAEPNADKVARVSMSSGAVTTYDVPTSAAHPVGVALGADGNIWFTENADNNIGEIALPKPTASNESMNVVAGKSVTVNVLSGATNNPDPSSVTIDSGPSHGTATINTSTGAITYTPSAGYTGTDSLSFIVCSLDDSGLCSADPILTFNVTASGTTPDTGYGKAPTKWLQTAGLVTASVLLIGAGIALRKKYSRS